MTDTKTKTYAADFRVKFRTADFSTDAAEALIETIERLGVLDGDGMLTEISTEVEVVGAELKGWPTQLYGYSKRNAYKAYKKE